MRQTGLCFPSDVRCSNVCSLLQSDTQEQTIERTLDRKAIGVGEMGRMGEMGEDGEDGVDVYSNDFSRYRVTWRMPSNAPLWRRSLQCLNRCLRRSVCVSWHHAMTRKQRLKSLLQTSSPSPLSPPSSPSPP